MNSTTLITDQDVLLVKGIGILVEFLAGTVALIPLILKGVSKRPPLTFFSIIDALAGGIFLSISLCHMGNDAASALYELNDFPLGLLMLGCGYLFIFMMEHVFFPTILRLVRPSEKEMKQLNLHLAEHFTEGDQPTPQNGAIAMTEKDGDGANGKSTSNGDLLEKGMATGEVVPVFLSPGLLYAITVLVVVCFHEIFEGLALGIQKGFASAVASMVALAFHKAIEAFAVGVAMSNSTLNRWLIVGLLLFYTLVAPVGIAIGIAITEDAAASADLASLYIAGFSAGTFFYIALIMLKEAFGRKEYLWPKMILTLGGYGVMSMLAEWA